MMLSVQKIMQAFCRSYLDTIMKVYSYKNGLGSKLLYSHTQKNSHNTQNNKGTKGVHNYY